MHGGDIYTRRVRADFSINVNPMGLAEPVRQALIRSADLCVHYPDPACRELRGMLAERASVETKQVVAGNGASELITAIVQAVQPRRALLLSPCFSGYERALEAAMAQCFYLSTDADHRFLPGEEWISELRQVRPDLVFLTNPGNPTGTMLEEDTPYNSRLYTGLPPTPICNPGLMSIQAALNPSHTNEFYYALDTETGEHRFFTNAGEFDAFVATQNYG